MPLSLYMCTPNVVFIIALKFISLFWSLICIISLPPMVFIKDHRRHRYWKWRLVSMATVTESRVGALFLRLYGRPWYPRCDFWPVSTFQLSRNGSVASLSQEVQHFMQVMRLCCQSIVRLGWPVVHACHRCLHLTTQASSDARRALLTSLSKQLQLQ